MQTSLICIWNCENLPRNNVFSGKGGLWCGSDHLASREWGIAMLFSLESDFYPHEETIRLFSFYITLTGNIINCSLDYNTTFFVESWTGRLFILGIFQVKILLSSYVWAYQTTWISLDFSPVQNVIQTIFRNGAKRLCRTIVAFYFRL